jgi:phospholipase/carboxylesterase/glyoxalase family protein
MLDSFVHRYLPPADNSGETLLLLHGTGGDERDLLPLGSQLGGGAGLLSPRGKVLENGMPRFFRRLAMGVFDIEDLTYRSHELAEFVRAAAKHYGFDPGKVTALGYSNGANIAASLLLLHPRLLARAVLLRPMVPLTPDLLPDLRSVPVFIAGGRRDPIVRPEETAKLVELLRQAGAPVDLQWSPGGHELAEEELAQVKLWLSRAAVQEEVRM